MTEVELRDRTYELVRLDTNTLVAQLAGSLIMNQATREMWSLVWERVGGLALSRIAEQVREVIRDRDGQ